MDKRLLTTLVCPVSNGQLVLRKNELWCQRSALAYPIRDNIPALLEREARQLNDDELESLKNMRDD